MKVDWTNKEYHSDTEYISKSGLMEVAKAPILYKLKYLDKDERLNYESTKALNFGAAAHEFILENDKFIKNNVVMPVFAGTGMRKTKADFMAQHEGKRFITQDDYAIIEGCNKSIKSHPIASILLFSGNAEQTFLWQDKDTGVKCKCRPDFINDRGDIVDLKFMTSAELGKFKYDMKAYAYDIQDAFYTDGLKSNGIIGDFYFVAIEKTFPFLVNVFKLSEYDRNDARERYKGFLKKFKECKDKNIWHGYEPIVQLINY